MSETKIVVEGYECTRCGHEWIPKKKGHPKVCPKCLSPWWDTPKKEFKMNNQR